MRIEAEPGTVTMPSKVYMLPTSSLLLPCAETTSGRVCGAPIGAA